MTSRGKEAQDRRLAIDGGRRAVTKPVGPIALGGLMLGAEEEAAVLECIRERRLFRYYGATYGPSKVEEFERALREHLGCAHALTVNSGTSALMGAMAALGVGPGDEVIIPGYTWISGFTSVVNVGAVPVVAEIDDTFSLDPADVASKITDRTKLIMPVHMCGAPCDMDSLLSIARERSLLVLEDVAQGMGASYRGQPLGTLGDAGAFSFQWNKMITAGEGGAITTDSQAVFDRAAMYHDVLGGHRLAKVEPSEVLPGNNLRMSEIQGALLLVQLERVDSMRSQLRAHRALLEDRLRPVLRSTGVRKRGLNDPEGETGTDLLLIVPADAADRVRRIARALVSEGVPAAHFLGDLHLYDSWLPLFLKATWEKGGGPWRDHGREVEYGPDMCPRTLELARAAIKISLTPTMTEEQVAQIAFGVEKVLERFVG